MRARTLTVAVVALLAGASVALAFRTAAANRHAARVDARQLLSSVSLPAGATASRSDPARHARLSGPNMAPASTALVDRHRFWRVPGDPTTVLAWIKAHAPAGSSLTSTSSSGGPGYSIEGLGFSFPAVRNVLLSTTLVVSVTVARRGGSAVRVDAEVVWIKPRPRSERVPAGVHVVTITDTLFDIHTGKSTTAAPTVLTAAAQVGRIVRLVNGLPLDQLGAVPCPADMGPTVAIKFYAAHGGPVLAQADADGTGCGTVGFTLNGKTEPTLSSGPGLIQHLDTLLGTKL